MTRARLRKLGTKLTLLAVALLLASCDTPPKVVAAPDAASAPSAKVEDPASEPPAASLPPCDAQQTTGCLELALDELAGRHQPRSAEKALASAVRACDSGDASACELAGFIQLVGFGLDKVWHPERGRGVPVHELEFMGPRLELSKHFEKGCTLGHAGACNALAVIWACAGTGPERVKQSATAIQRACALGEQWICKLSTDELQARHGGPARVFQSKLAGDDPELLACRNGQDGGAVKLGVGLSPSGVVLFAVVVEYEGVDIDTAECVAKLFRRRQHSAESRGRMVTSTINIKF